MDVDKEGLKEKVPLDVLASFYTELPKVDLMRLAAKLKCTEQEIMVWTSSGRPVADIAMEVLLDWKKREPLNGRFVLGKAFTDIKRNDLYDLLQKRCDAAANEEAGAGATTLSGATTAAASSSTTETGRGKKMKPGVLFRNISKRFTKIKYVCDLADGLLEGIEEDGGAAWVKAKKDDGGTLDPTERARDLLDYWCEQSSEPYGGKLYKELNDVLPNVAKQFKDDLL